MPFDVGVGGGGGVGVVPARRLLFIATAVSRLALRDVVVILL